MQTLSKSFCTVWMVLSWMTVGVAAEVTSADPLPRGITQQKPTDGPSVKTELGYMVPYTETIAGTEVTFEMIPVPGGTFVFGSSAPKEDRGEYDLPAIEVELPPFWIAKHEVTWAMYWPYMRLNDDFAKLQALHTQLHSTEEEKSLAARTALEALPKLIAAVEQEATEVDGVTAPTPLYDPSKTYESGDDPRLPAATMTPYAAKQFSKWLSLTVGVGYRLPTEAEWEYAARAGSTTTYPFGDDPSELGAYAWYEENSEAVAHPIGEKKPNAWGLHDMIGNVAEWVMDEYDEELLDRQIEGQLDWNEAIRWPTSNTGRVVRGGFWDEMEEDCQSTSRFYSEDRDWKSSDPNLPLSPWWYADDPSTGIGIRLVRPLHPLTPELAKRFWESNSDYVAEDVDIRVQGGRAKRGAVNPQLPHALADLEVKSVRSLLEQAALEKDALDAEIHP